MTGSYRNLLRPLLVVALPCLMSGCFIRAGTEDVRILPEVEEYHRYALVGLQAESEELFRELFLEAFPETEFVDRQEVMAMVPEEDFFSGRLTIDAVRSVGSSLGADAVLTLTWVDSGTGGTLDWSMTITNTETGERTGTATAQVRKEPLARGASFEELEKRAFEALISALEDQLHGAGRLP